MSEWVRQGDCNQCGDCCRQAVNPITMFIPIKDEAYGRIRFGEHVSVDRAGVKVFAARGPLYAPCPLLQGDKCGIQGEKPQYCQDTPCSPEDIELLPRCSYTFVNTRTGEVRGGAGVLEPGKEHT